MGEYTSKNSAVQLSIVASLAERVAAINHGTATREQTEQLRVVMAYVTNAEDLRSGNLMSTFQTLLGIGKARMQTAMQDQLVFSGGREPLVATRRAVRADRLGAEVDDLVQTFVHQDGVTEVDKSDYRPLRVHAGSGVYTLKVKRLLLVTTMRELTDVFLVSPQYREILATLSKKQRPPKGRRGAERLLARVMKQMPWVRKPKQKQCVCKKHQECEHTQPSALKYLHEKMKPDPVWRAKKLSQLHHAAVDVDATPAVAVPPLGACKRRVPPKMQRRDPFQTHLQRRAEDPAATATPASSELLLPNKLDCDACYAEARAAGMPPEAAVDYTADKFGENNGYCDHVLINSSPTALVRRATRAFA